MDVYDVLELARCHESSGHHTYQCRQLKDEIKELILEGYLTKWVVKEVKRYKEDPERRKNGGRTSSVDNKEKPKASSKVEHGSVQLLVKPIPEP